MKKFLKGFVFAYQGLSYAFSTQINFKFHVFTALSTVVLGFYVDLPLNEWLWIVASIALVLIIELLNTAIEVLVDLISPGFNVKAGLIKDISAAAVLITAIFAILVGLFVFVPKLI